VRTQAYHRRRAEYLRAAGLDEAAASAQRDAARMAATSALDHFLAGQDHYRRGADALAIGAFENVLQLQPDHFWANYHLALCWLKGQRPGQAVACLTACLGQRRDFAWLYLLRGAARSELGQYDRAEADFACAAQMPLSDSSRYALYLNRGVLRVRQERATEALADFEQAVALRPDQYQGYVNLAQAFLQGQQFAAALRHLDAAIARAPQLASLYRTRARVYVLQQEPAAALADLERAAALAAGASSSDSARDHSERARLLHGQGKHERALEACALAVRQNPADDQVRRLKADILLTQEHWPEALVALDECLTREPANLALLRNRAALRVRLGQYTGAQADYTRALELGPDPATYAERGWCYLVADMPRPALADFEQALQRGLAGGNAYAGRGFALAQLGQARRAAADGAEALRRGPSSPRLHYNVARVFAQAAQAPAEARNAWLADAWQQRAVQLLSDALAEQAPAEAATMWQLIAADKVLTGLRRIPAFAELGVRYALRQARAERVEE
jgi:tetratricopeptide (TPR) repeat protein